MANPHATRGVFRLDRQNVLNSVGQYLR